MAPTLSGKPARRLVGGAAARCSTVDQGCASRGCRHEDLGIHARQQHALEHPAYGQEGRTVADRQRADLASLWATATSCAELQVLKRPAVRGEGARHRWAVQEPAGARHRPLCGREKPGAGLESNTADSTAGAGGPARQSHDYERHGVTSLFAALDVASGVTISSCYRQHRHREFLRFLNDIDAGLPRALDVHLIMDNYGTHKVKKVRAWLARRPRYHAHCTPTSASWLNLVERLFAEVTERCVRRGSHTAVGELEKAMLTYLKERNRNPKPFVWTADADLILGKVERLCQRIGVVP